MRRRLQTSDKVLLRGSATAEAVRCSIRGRLRGLEMAQRLRLYLEAIASYDDDERRTVLDKSPVIVATLG